MKTYYKSINFLIIFLLLNIGVIGFCASVTIHPNSELTKIGEVSTGGDAYDVWVDEEKQIAYVTCGYQGVLHNRCGNFWKLGVFIFLEKRIENPRHL